MKWRSIRWGIVASMMLVTFVTVLTVGVLTQALVAHEIAARERAVLHANALAVARQALPLLDGGTTAALDAGTTAALAELADTAGFLAEARVVIADDTRTVVVDTGPSDTVDEFVWSSESPTTELHSGAISIEGIGSDRRLLTLVRSGTGVGVQESDDRMIRVDAGTRLPSDVAVVRRLVGPFGGVLEFDVVPARTAVGLRITAREPATRSAGVAFDGDAGIIALSVPDVTNALSASPLLLTLSRVDGTDVTVPIGDPTEPRGFVTLVAGADFGRAALAAAQRALAIAGMLAMVVSAVVGLVLSRGLTTPLGNLAAAAERMGGGDLSTRAPVTGAEEIVQVGRQFNHMAERLAASFDELAAERDALRRFVSDASHELRTPITALSNFTELLQGPAGGDPATRAEFLAESVGQLDRLKSITTHLLDLSRIEMGLTALDRMPRDVGALLACVGAAHRAAAEAYGVDLTIARPVPEVRIACDGARIEMALANLVDNALKFAPRGSVVTLGAEVVDDAVRLWVHDSGPAIDAEEAPHLFARFYRGRRALASGAPGSGLGLAIVEAVARAHGGEARLELPPAGGNRFVIALPRSDQRVVAAQR